MQVRRTFGGIAALALISAMATTGVASAASLKGTVVHRNTHAHSFAIATSSGRLAAVHSANRPRAGRVVVVSARSLRNGTFAASKVRTVGRSHRARFRGTVTYAQRAKGVYTVSSNGVSLLVHRRLRGARAATLATDVPPVGTIVTVVTQINDDGTVEAEDVQQQGQDTNGIEIEGRVLAIDQVARTLSISSDDDEVSTGNLLVHVPATFDLKQFTVGQEVKLLTTLQTDGSYLLTGSSSDDNENEADGENNQQGAQGDDDGPSPQSDQKHAPQGQGVPQKPHDGGGNGGNGGGDNGGGND
jgi:hypothetical protein